MLKYSHSCTLCLKAVWENVYRLFRCLSVSHNVRDQISSCFLHTRSAQITAHSNATKPLAVAMATNPLQPIRTPPLPYPLATAAAQKLCELARHPILQRAMCIAFIFFPRQLPVCLQQGKSFSFKPPPHF